MKIVIPTMRRVNQQHTAQQLWAGKIPLKYDCFLVVPDDELNDHLPFTNTYKFGCLSVHCIGINNVRQWIVEHCSDDKILMIDDDLSFFRRTSLEDFTLRPCFDNEILEIIEWIDHKLDDYAHVSISARTQNFQTTSRLLQHNSLELELVRPWRIYGFRKDIILGEQLDFHAGLEVNTMDDFHMTLQLLELGYPNLVWFQYAHEQRGSNSAGGASTYRDLELLKVCADNLKAKHPGIVETVQRKTINSWGGTPKNPVYRTDVRIQWMKALGIRAMESKLWQG